MSVWHDSAISLLGLVGIEETADGCKGEASGLSSTAPGRFNRSKYSKLYWGRFRIFCERKRGLALNRIEVL
jgi:hypothetical protein